MAGHKLHHIEIHPHEGGGYRAEHHLEAEGGAKHIQHEPERGSEEGMEPDDMAEHVEQILREHEDNYDEPEETAEEEKAQPKPEEKHKKIAEHHRGNNPMGIGRDGPVRSY